MILVHLSLSPKVTFKPQDYGVITASYVKEGEVIKGEVVLSMSGEKICKKIKGFLIS